MKRKCFGFIFKMMPITGKTGQGRGESVSESGEDGNFQRMVIQIPKLNGVTGHALCESLHPWASPLLLCCHLTALISV